MKNLLSKKEIKLLLVVFVAVIILYLPLFKGFFQQDEWFSFGWYVSHSDLNFLDKLKFLFAPSVAHYNPFTNTLQYVLFSYWGMNYVRFVTIGILLHLCVVAAVFLLARNIFKNNTYLAFLSAFLFGVLASPYQGTAWVVADMSTLISSFLGLISAILFFRFLEHKKNSYLVWSLSILIISLLFKEITIGLFVFYATYYLLFYGKKAKAKDISMILLFGGLYFLFRLIMLFIPNTGDQLVTQSLSFSKLLYNFLTIPFRSITQILFPSAFMKKIAFDIAGVFPKKITGGFGAPQFETFAVKRVMEFMSLFVGIVIIILTFIIAKTEKRKTRMFLFFGLGWVVANSFIFSISPETSGVTFVVDSRNLYFTSVGISIFLVGILNIFLHKNKTKMSLFFLIIFAFNAYWLNKNLAGYVEAGTVRKNILENVKSVYKTLPDKVMFYINSDSSYYGLPEDVKILPFQSGLGQTLLVWYYSTEKFPPGFFENKFLWDIDSQGYKEIDGRGFGYYRDFDLLQEAIKSYRFPIDSVYSFTWENQTSRLQDTTRAVRENLKSQK